MRAETRIANSSNLGTRETLRRGVQISPLLTKGIVLTLVLAVVAALGKVVVPLVVQRVVDDFIGADGQVNLGAGVRWVLFAAAIVVASALASSQVNFRLFRTSEGGLRQLRVRAFDHIHRLSSQTQDTERRGALVSRVTSDVDSISLFVQWGGIMLLVAVVQLSVATVLMFIYSWALALIVWACFIPLMFYLSRSQRKVGQSFAKVRTNTGALLGDISESVVGAETIRVFGAQTATEHKLEESIERARSSQFRAQRRVAVIFAGGVWVTNLTLAVVIVCGVLLGMADHLTAGQIIAFLFLVQLFTGPVQQATEILNELQSALAGWRRVIGIIDTPVDIASPPDGGVLTPHGPGQLRVQDVNYAYVPGRPVLQDICVEFTPGTKTAIVGETGSGKSTLAKLLTRFIDPDSGSVSLDGHDLRDVSLSNLRERILFVPQDGFLFDHSLLFNITYGTKWAQVAEQDQRKAVLDAVQGLGLQDWLSGLSHGLATELGQRGENLSAGERQLVAIIRAYLIRADIIVLDEATSDIDPATELRLARALDELTRDKTTITIAHRLSTAETSDVVIVMDQGQVVQRGSHAHLVTQAGVYQQMHTAWMQHTR